MLIGKIALQAIFVTVLNCKVTFMAISTKMRSDVIKCVIVDKSSQNCAISKLIPLVKVKLFAVIFTKRS